MTIHVIDSGIPFDSNIYLVVAERTMLIDAGTGLGSDRVISGIRSILADRRLDMIVATHCHFDHVGGLHDLVSEFGCEVYAGELDAPRIRDADDRYTLASAFGGLMAPVDVTGLSDGDVIDLGDRRFRTIWTPGHTEGGICLYDESSGTLFSGDTLFETGVGRTDFAGGSMTSLRRSIGFLSNIDIRELYPGHGQTCENYDPAMMARIMTLVGM